MPLLEGCLQLLVLQLVPVFLLILGQAVPSPYHTARTRICSGEMEKRAETERGGGGKEERIRRRGR